MAITYRPDIDGLRAVAVLLVVFFHTGFGFAPGGFIGVDVFFVISGYLITSIVHRDVKAGTFSFRGFYVRRIRRLFPAYFTVIAATSVVAAWQLLPQDLVTYARSLAAASLSMANVFFWRSQSAYFAPTTDEMPLLHMWSLSVEEQFYLVWPLFIVLTGRLWSERRTWLVAACIGVASLAVSEWAATAYPRAAFYLLPTRAFELMIGALLALGGDRLPALPRTALRASGAVGLGLVLTSGALLTSTSPVPGFHVLWAALGTALLIHAGRDAGGPVTRLLGWRPLVAIGLVSYSVYLWHWPLVAFANYRLMEWTPALQWGVVAASLGLGSLSWKLVEQPFRYRRTHAFGRTFWQHFAGPAAVTVAVAIVVISQDGFASRLEGDAAYQAILRENRFADSDSEWCHYTTGGLAVARGAVESCRLGVPEGEASTHALLVGDSHGGHYTPFIDALADSAHASVVVLTAGGCSPALDPGRWGNDPEVCRYLADAFRTKVDSADVVVIAGRWEYLVQEDRLAGLLDLVRFAAGRTGDVVVLAQVPLFRQNLRACALRALYLFGGGTRCATEWGTAVDEAFAKANRAVREAVSPIPGVRFVEVDRLLCERGCSPYLDGDLVYFDESHLSVRGAQRLAGSATGSVFGGAPSP